MNGNDDIIELIRETERNLPLVPDSVPECMRFSVAKYWKCLKRLSAE